MEQPPSARHLGGDLNLKGKLAMAKAKSQPNLSRMTVALDVPTHSPTYNPYEVSNSLSHDSRIYDYGPENRPRRQRGARKLSAETYDARQHARSPRGHDHEGLGTTPPALVFPQGTRERGQSFSATEADEINTEIIRMSSAFKMSSAERGTSASGLPVLPESDSLPLEHGLTIPRMFRVGLPPSHSQHVKTERIDALKLMQQGTQLLKFSKRGSPHFRIVSLSGNRITWHNQKNKKSKARGEISLGDVTAVVLGQATQGFRNAPRSLALACFSLTLGAEGSSVDFMAVNERDLAVWTTALPILVNQWRLRRGGLNVSDLPELVIDVPSYTPACEWLKLVKAELGSLAKLDWTSAEDQLRDSATSPGPVVVDQVVGPTPGKLKSIFSLVKRFNGDSNSPNPTPQRSQNPTPQRSPLNSTPCSPDMTPLNSPNITPPSAFRQLKVLDLSTVSESIPIDAIPTPIASAPRPIPGMGASASQQLLASVRRSQTVDDPSQSMSPGIPDGTPPQDALRLRKSPICSPAAPYKSGKAVPAGSPPVMGPSLATNFGGLGVGEDSGEDSDYAALYQAADFYPLASGPATNFNVLQFLRRGSWLIKLAKMNVATLVMGSPPGGLLREFWLDRHNDALCWNSFVKTPDESHVLLSAIDAIVFGQTTSRFREHKAPRELAPVSFTILYDNRTKSLDLIAPSMFAFEVWTEGLTQLILKGHRYGWAQLKRLPSLVLTLPPPDQRTGTRDEFSEIVRNRIGVPRFQSSGLLNY